MGKYHDIYVGDLFNVKIRRSMVKVVPSRVNQLYLGKSGGLMP
jgi:hypothetical protein